jgi:15-cis-phytoene desaturase
VGVTAGRRILKADHVVLATSVRPAQNLLQAAFPDATWLKPFLKLQTTPVVTFQIELTHPALKFDRATFGPGTCLASFSEQSRTTFPGSPGRLSIILSPPHEFEAMPAKAILERVIADAKKLNINLADKVAGYRKIYLPHDFYALSPGQNALRPTQKTPVPSLTLAGDYTRQEFLATMEGAVVSGQRAAAAVMQAAL